MFRSLSEIKLMINWRTQAPKPQVIKNSTRFKSLCEKEVKLFEVYKKGAMKDIGISLSCLTSVSCALFYCDNVKRFYVVFPVIENNINLATQVC